MRKYKFYRKYELTQAERESTYWYAMRYNELKREQKLTEDTLKAIPMERDPKGNLSDSETEKAAIDAGDIKSKISLIERTAKDASGDLYKWILYAVTTRGAGYEVMKTKDIPCGKNTFYEARRKFYYLLAKRL